MGFCDLRNNDTEGTGARRKSYSEKLNPKTETKIGRPVSRRAQKRCRNPGCVSCGCIPSAVPGGQNIRGDSRGHFHTRSIGFPTEERDGDSLAPSSFFARPSEGENPFFHPALNKTPWLFGDVGRWCRRALVYRVVWAEIRH